MEGPRTREDLRPQYQKSVKIVITLSNCWPTMDRWDATQNRNYGAHVERTYKLPLRLSSAEEKPAFPYPTDALAHRQTQALLHCDDHGCSMSAVMHVECLVFATCLLDTFKRKLTVSRQLGWLYVKNSKLGCTLWENLTRSCLVYLYMIAVRFLLSIARPLFVFEKEARGNRHLILNTPPRILWNDKKPFTVRQFCPPTDERWSKSEPYWS